MRPVPTDITRAISTYGEAERAFACAVDLDHNSRDAQDKLDAAIDAALALDALIASHIAKIEDAVPLAAGSFSLHPQWRDYLPS
jgi:hypothetical protein